MIDENSESGDRVQKLNAVADFELRSFGANYKRPDHIDSRVICGL